MKRTRLAVARVVLLSGLVACCVSADAETPGVPDVMNGFLGMVEGTIVTKGPETFVLRIARIERTWKKNRAKNAEKAIGKNVPFVVNRHMRERYASLKVGDSIVVGGIHRGRNLQVGEVLVRTSEFPALQKKWAAARAKRDAERRERESSKKSQKDRVRRGVTNARFVSLQESGATVTIEGKTSTMPVTKKLRERFASLKKGRKIRINWVTEGDSSRWITGLELFPEGE